MNAFGGMFAGYQDPYRMAAGLPDPAGAMGMHAHHAHHMQHVHHGYKVPRIYFKIPRVLPFKEQKEKYETDDYFKKLARESEVTLFSIFRGLPKTMSSQNRRFSFPSLPFTPFKFLGIPIQ